MEAMDLHEFLPAFLLHFHILLEMKPTSTYSTRLSFTVQHIINITPVFFNIQLNSATGCVSYNSFTVKWHKYSWNTSLWKPFKQMQHTNRPLALSWQLLVCRQRWNRISAATVWLFFGKILVATKDRIMPVEGQHGRCCCPSSLHRQDMTSHGIG